MAFINSATSSIRVGTSPINRLYIGNTLAWTAGPVLIAEDTFDRANATGAAAVGNGWFPELSSTINIFSNSLQWMPGGGSGYQRVSTTFPSAPAITGNIAV